jgi:hypothetical protein
MYGRFLTVAALALATAGCAAPLVRPNPITFQSKVEHVADWQALADRTVDHFAATLHTNPPSVFVAPGPADMPFAGTYRKFLQQALLRRGYSVVESASDAVVLNFDVQTFLYGDRNQKYPVEYATFWTTAGAIGTQLRHVASYDTGVGIGAAVGPIIDVLASINDTTRAEVTLTLTVADDTRLHYLTSETFYVQPSDLPFYWSRLPASVPQTMPSNPAGLTVVSLPITGGPSVGRGER